MGVFRRYLEALSVGDPVALAATVVILLFALVMGIVWYKSARELREDEKKKPGRRRP
jgi:hypothetical protein